MSEEKLANTINDFNSLDAEDKYKRDLSTKRSFSGPYYAIEVGPALLNTQGGARRDDEARILNHKEEYIPGLYSAGEFGSIWGFLYQGATNIMECLVFGRLAGSNAAKYSRSVPKLEEKIVAF